MNPTTDSDVKLREFPRDSVLLPAISFDRFA